MDVPIKTSQTIWSDPGGKPPPTPPKQYGDEPRGAPGPVTEPIKGEIMKVNVFKTSQQKARDHDLSEGE